MEHLLVAALAAALVVTLYDSLVTGPGWARILLTGAAAMVAYLQLDEGAWRRVIVGGLAAGFVALVLLAVLQYLLVLRDASMTSVLRRR